MHLTLREQERLMIYVAAEVPHGLSERFGAVFWYIAFGAIAMQILLSPAANRFRDRER